VRILLLGKNGQVGCALQRSLAPLGEVIALDRHGLRPRDDEEEGPRDDQEASLRAQRSNPQNEEKDMDRHGLRPRDDGESSLRAQRSNLCGDLADLDGIARTVATVRPDVIVNAAAYTAVDKAESEADVCRAINTDAVAVLARAASPMGALLVHYSTDYVFNGSGDTPWVETDATGPLNVYGQSKLDGEKAIALSGCSHLIFRTSWVYGLHGGNFAKTMLRLAQEREQLKVINDQVGAPTSAELIAHVTAQAIRATQGNLALRGLYHLAAAGQTTWHGYAQRLIEQARGQYPDAPWKVQSIEPVPTSAFPTAAQRPHNSRLNSQKLQSAFGLTLPRWEDGVDGFAAIAMTKTSAP
jgi:dTDP-4-dehydrorhamnose reductase